MKNAIQKMIEQIHRICGETPVRLMEVCGTHTMAIHQHGLRSLFPASIHLVSGPGCPVCVTPIRFIDRVIELCKIENNVICTFGDLIRVPGSKSSLENEKMQGRDIKVVYSPVDALKLALANREKNYIFVGIGFETTAPAVASVIEMAAQRGMDNFSVACAHKTMPNALNQLARDNQIRIDGFICPGHVSAIIGMHPYEFLPQQYNIACAIAGFEAHDILDSVLMLCRQIQTKRFLVELQYKRVVKPQGNLKALAVMNRVFRHDESEWRGLGIIPASGLSIRAELRDYDAFIKQPIEVKNSVVPTDCICGDILKGLKTPLDCKLFAKRCTPDAPVGACMVSSEGTCAAYYKYCERKTRNK